MKVYVDPKADEALVPVMQAMVARGEVFQVECNRRGVKFLPKQVLRPLFTKAGLADGAILKTRQNDFFTLNGRLSLENRP